ncbi:hypothetical protein PM082_018374 [Marasmius tenuissimus]|nr:hypothetical protein PM082_018374 [Marasmius tenuissimus]
MSDQSQFTPPSISDDAKIARMDANHFGRQILASALTHEPTHRGISKERLELFQQQPKVHGPTTTSECLDLTGGSPKDMRASHWNKELIYRLTSKARSIISMNHEFAHLEKNEGFWHGFFAKRIHALLLESHQRREKESKEGERSDTQTEVERSSSGRYKKYHRRMRIAATMHRKCRADGREEEEERWGFILCSVDALTAAGMSDEENGYDEDLEEDVTYVHEVDFRHEGFRRVLDGVDDAPEAEPSVFSKKGRKRKRRVRSGIVKKHKPPPHLAPQLFRASYLDIMQKGLIEMVPLGSDDEEAARYLADEETTKQKRYGTCETNTTSTDHPTIMHSPPLLERTFPLILACPLIGLVIYYFLLQ